MTLAPEQYVLHMPTSPRNTTYVCVLGLESYDASGGLLQVRYDAVPRYCCPAAAGACSTIQYVSCRCDICGTTMTRALIPKPTPSSCCCC